MTDAPPRLVTVGGSEVAAVVGLDPWQDATTLAAHKLGLIPGRPESEAMRLGTILEPVIAGLYAEREGVTLTRCGSTLHDPDRAWCVGRPDYLTADASAVVEVKTVGQLAHRQGWDDGPPVWYQAQCQWYLHLMQLDRAVLVALVGGQRLDVFQLDRDDAAIDYLLDAAESFVRMVRRGTLPDPDGSATARTTLAYLFPEHAADRVVRAGKKEQEAVRELRRIHEAEAVLEEQRLRAENTLKMRMGDAETLLHPDDRPLAHWRTVRQTRIDTAALKRGQPALAAEYSATTTTRRFTLA